MSKKGDRLSEAKEAIRRRLRVLDKDEEKLNREARNLHKSMIPLKSWLKKINAKKIPPKQLRDIATELGIDIRTDFPLMALARYFVRKEIHRRLSEAKRRMDEIPRELKSIKIDRRDASICPNCGGRGVLEKRRYVREDGIVAPITIREKCSLCRGKGRIKIELTQK